MREGGFGSFARMAIGAALLGGGEMKKAYAGEPVIEPTVETSAFAPKTITPDVRRPKVMRAEPGQTEAPVGYHAQGIPGGIQFAEDVPEGWYVQSTESGRQFVQKCPEGYHAVSTPRGTMYVENDPNHPKPQTEHTEAEDPMNRREMRQSIKKSRQDGK